MLVLKTIIMYITLCYFFFLFPFLLHKNFCAIFFFFQYGSDGFFKIKNKKRIFIYLFVFYQKKKKRHFQANQKKKNPKEEMQTQKKNKKKYSSSSMFNFYLEIARIQQNITLHETNLQQSKKHPLECYALQCSFPCLTFSTIKY